MSKRNQDRNNTARESEAEAKAAQDAARVEQDRQIAAAVGNRNTEQVNLRNAIAERLDATEERQMQDIDGDQVVENDPEEDARRAELAAEQAREVAEREANERAARQEQDGGEVAAEPKKYKLKVNGREVELTEEQVLERAAKVASADEYLQSAAEAVRRSQASGPSATDGSTSVGEDDVEDTLNSALMGDKEAIKKIAQRLKAPSAVTPDVLSAVDERLSFRSAVEWFRDAYKDVVEDPMLYRLVTEQDSALAKAEPTLAYRERLKRAGDSVRSWKAGLTKSASDANPKLARKASVVPVPSAAGRQAQTTDEDDADEPVETVIEKMARARHQSGAVRRQ